MTDWGTGRFSNFWEGQSQDSNPRHGLQHATGLVTGRPNSRRGDVDTDPRLAWGLLVLLCEAPEGRSTRTAPKQARMECVTWQRMCEQRRAAPGWGAWRGDSSRGGGPRLYASGPNS